MTEFKVVMDEENTVQFSNAGCFVIENQSMSPLVLNMHSTGTDEALSQR